jgi:translocation protein SEC72
MSMTAPHQHPHPHPNQSEIGGPQPIIPTNPALTALLDSLPSTNLPFIIAEVPIPNSQPPQSASLVVCPPHKRQTCPECGVNFAPLNHMHQYLREAPPEAIPPPPNMPPQPQRAAQIKAAKDHGNVSV